MHFSRRLLTSGKCRPIVNLEYEGTPEDGLGACAPRGPLTAGWSAGWVLSTGQNSGACSHKYSAGESIQMICEEASRSHAFDSPAC